jgi:hypothetical protein
MWIRMELIFVNKLSIIKRKYKNVSENFLVTSNMCVKCLQTALCGLGSYWKMLSAKFVNFVGVRAAYGYQLGMSCVAPNAARQNIIAEIYSAESSSDCTGQTAAVTTAAPTRRKRSATVAGTFGSNLLCVI